LDGTPVAVKELLPINDQIFKKEVGMLISFRHQNIVLLTGFCKAPNCFCIITELFEKGSLHHLLENREEKIDNDRCLKFALDIARGMNYLHKRNVLHLDLKPLNILVDNGSVFCSKAKRNVNMILSRKSPYSDMRAAPFSVNYIMIRTPSIGYSCPLKKGFIFICSDKVSLDTFDHYDDIDTSNLLDPLQDRRTLPFVPVVLMVLYFHFEAKSPIFLHHFHTPVKDARYIYVKFMESFDHSMGRFGSIGNNIDVEFIGFAGNEGKLGFPSGEFA